MNLYVDLQVSVWADLYDQQMEDMDNGISFVVIVFIVQIVAKSEKNIILA